MQRTTRQSVPGIDPPAPRREHAGRNDRKVTERGGDRVASIALSVLVHALIVGALLWGWWQYRNPHPAPQTLAIEGTIVREAPAQRSPPVTRPVTATPTPPIDAAQLAQQRAAAQAAAAKLQTQQQAAEAATRAAAAKAEAERAAAQEVAAQRQAEEQRHAEEQHRAEEQARRAAKLAAERKAQEEALLKAKQEAERRAKEEAAREQQLLAQQLKAEQAARQREADLQSQVRAEERLNALQNGPAETTYRNAITARIERAWVRPASAQPGVKCTVHLTQIPGGDVTKVQVDACNGDEAVRQSVETAVYRASPLPVPPDPALFDPNVTITFAPDQ